MQKQLRATIKLVPNISSATCIHAGASTKGLPGELPGGPKDVEEVEDGAGRSWGRWRAPPLQVQIPNSKPQLQAPLAPPEKVNLTIS